MSEARKGKRKKRERVVMTVLGSQEEWLVAADYCLKHTADAVRTEREACAVIAEADPPDKNAMTPGDLAVYRVHAKNIARRVRARTPASGEEKG